MQKRKSVLSAVCAVIMFIASIIFLVEAFTGLSDLNSTNTSGYSDSIRQLLSSLIALSIIEIIVTFIVLILLFACIVCAFRDSDYLGYNASKVLAFALIVLVLEKIMSVLGGVIIADKYASASADAATIVGIVFLFLSLILFFICSITVKSQDLKNITGTTGVCGSIFLIVVFIIAVADSSSSTTLQIIYTVFMILASLVIFVRFCYEFVTDSSVSYSNPVVDTSAQADTKTNNDVDVAKEEQKIEKASDKLVELKKLYDSGVITEEEYNSKRQKYIDQL